MKKEELLKMKSALISGEKTPQEIGEVLFKEEVNSWQTKEWKENREKVIKDYCEQCSTTEGIMVIQHLWHPSKYNDVRESVRDQYKNKWREENPIDEVISDQTAIEKFKEIKKETKEVCPYCLSGNVRERKTGTPKYKCLLCKKDFDEKSKKEIPFLYNDSIENDHAPRKTKSVVYLSDYKRKLYFLKSGEMYWEEYGEKIRYETILQIIDEYLRYISLEDAVTFCKKCAFLWDVKNMDLCPKCKKEYKSRYLENVCATCN